MNKPIELGEITPYHLNKKIIFALDEGWLDHFVSKNSNFQIVINDGKIMLIGPKVSWLDPTTKPTASKQEISNFG